MSPRGRLHRTASNRPGLHAKQQSSTVVVRRHRPDYMLVVYMSILLVVGAITVYAISPGITAAQGFSENHFSYKQLVAIVLGICAFAVASVMKIELWRKLAWPLVIAAIAVSLAVRLFGDPINGAYRWLDIGGISFQAAELIKFSLVIWLAGYLADRRSAQQMHEPATFKTLSIVLGIVVVVVAWLQSDLGSAAVMMAIIGMMAFVAGLPMKRLLIVGLVIIFLSSIAIMSSSYRRDRIATFLNPAADCQNEGYQACQALITVGSGGLFGKGLGRSVQAYGYLPEAANDSIFAIVAEKFGFIGSSAVVIVFVLLFRRMKWIAERAPNDYSRLLIMGILAWLSVQMIINVSAMLGLLPLKGITLPFVSYGGTSIIFVMAAVGIVFHISRYTDLATSIMDREYGTSNRPTVTRRYNHRRVSMGREGGGLKG